MFKFLYSILCFAIIYSCSFRNTDSKMKVSEIKAKLEKKYSFVNEYFKKLNKKDDDSMTFTEFLNRKSNLNNSYNEKNKDKFKPFFSELSNLLFKEYTNDYKTLQNCKVENNGTDKNNKMNLTVFLKPNDGKISIDPDQYFIKKKNKKYNNKKQNKKHKRNKIHKKRINKNNNLKKLYDAVYINDIKGIEKLLKKNVNPNKRYEENDYPIIISAEKGYIEALKLLLKYKANPSLRDIMNNFDTILIAVFCNQYKIVEILLKYNPNLINSKTTVSKRNSLHLVSLYGHFETAKVLLKHLIIHKNLNFLNQIDVHENTPLNLAASNKKNNTLLNKKYKISNLLLDLGADVNIANIDKTSPLHNSAINKNLVLINLCLDKKAEVNKQDKFGCTALHYVINHDLELIESFLFNGANPFLKNNNNKTALDIIDDKKIHINKKDLLKYILVLFKKENGNSFIHDAAYNHEKMKYIFNIYPEININIQNDSQETPIDLALKNLKIETLIEILKHVSNTKEIYHKYAIYDIENYYKELKEQKIKTNIKEISLQLIELNKEREKLEKQNIQGSNEFELAYIDTKLTRQLISFMGNLINLMDIDKENEGINLKSRFRDCFIIFKGINKKMFPIIKNINSEENLTFITNKYIQQKKYLEILKTIAYYWIVKAKLNIKLSKRTKIDISKKILRDYEKAINVLKKAGKYINKYNIQNINKIKLNITEVILKKLEFIKSQNLTNYDNSLQNASDYIEKWQTEFQKQKTLFNTEDLRWYELKIRITKLKDESKINFKNYYHLYLNANILYEDQKINKLQYAKFLSDYEKSANSDFNSFINKIEQEIKLLKKNDYIEKILFPILHSLFTALFKIYFELYDFEKCKKLCEEMKKYKLFFKINC